MQCKSEVNEQIIQDGKEIFIVQNVSNKESIFLIKFAVSAVETF